MCVATSLSGKATSKSKHTVVSKFWNLENKHKNAAVKSKSINAIDKYTNRKLANASIQ